MKLHYVIKSFYPDPILWIGALLTFLLFFSSLSCAEDYTQLTPGPLLSDRPSNTALANADRDYQRSLLLNYVRHQAPALVPGLPNAMRAPASFAMQQLNAMGDVFDFNDGSDEKSEGALHAFLSPVFSIMRPADETVAESMWLAPDYHHAHGVLPFSDAVMLGVNYRNSFLADRVKLTIHPFYAQSWNSGDGYWGTEMAIGLGPEAGHSWGKISLRYSDGSSYMMDNNTSGYDIHAELAFSDHLSLSAGAQQNQSSDAGNYILLRWHLVGGDRE